MSRLTVLTIAFATLLPAPAEATTTTTFVAPFLSATVETEGGTPDPPFADASADAVADAADGRARVHAFTATRHPIPTFDKGATAAARFALGQITLDSGRLRVTSVLTGKAFARRTTTLEATRGSHAFVIAATTFSLANIVDLRGTTSPLSESEVTASGRMELEQTVNLTEDGFCPPDPITVGANFVLAASASARNVSTYEAFADVVLESVTVEQLPCVPEPAQVDVQVSSETFSYSPSSVTVPVGTVVEWSWDGGFPHTVTADDGSFASPTQSDGTFTHRFDAPGTYGYHCELHGAPGEGMAGTVTVT